MAVVATDLILLPSKVDESLAACPQFRILVVGNSGVGKSSLISSIFDIDLNDIDIAHDRAGRAKVEYAYISDRNQYFILHDSQGFEAGDTSNWESAERFLRTKSSDTTELKDRVHAIWLCIETPRTGVRGKETGDENLLSLAKELNIPTIVVFTKFDLLVNEHLQKRQGQKPWVTKQKVLLASQRSAEEDFKLRIERSFLQEQVLCVRVSNKERDIQKLDRLTEVTYQSLPGEEGPLLAWVAAQQVNARQKVEESIRQGCKKYWINLGQSVVFRDRRLIDCLLRISQDILMIWNFNDPNNLLSTDGLFSKIIHLVNEFSPAENDQDGDGPLKFLYKIIPFGIGGSTLTQTFEFLYQAYKAIPATAQYLGAYIIDLTLVLHRIFTATLHTKPPRVVSESLIDDQLQEYTRSELRHNHRGVRGISVTAAGFERRIAELILASPRLRGD